ncbi:MAG: hypothetical protein IBX55_07360 [Methyloprofundus sp.]|nr:hypothetical protein [Methyloprofundus sp.]MBW6453174.1 hypothetical protein [Methyloprofundus sp.]
MPNSNSQQPDLDWSQVRETVKLLTLSATQVQSSIREGEQSVTTLTESFTSMVDSLSEINKALEAIEDSPAKDKILQHYRLTNEKVQSSIIAFQFYDRMQQCLQHVTDNLSNLSKIIDSPQLLYNPIEWSKLQDKIRKGYTMESEKIMFDAILQGKTLEQAMQLAAEQANSHQDDDDIELF